MRTGHVDVATRAAVSGWAADPAEPDAAIEITVQVDDAAPVPVRADRPRADLARLGQYGAGRHGFRHEFAGALDDGAYHVIVVRFASDGALLANGQHVWRAPAGAHVEPAPAAVPAGALPSPILVTAPGRSGTTLMMRMLAASPEIVAAELVPYETRLLAYYAVAHGVLTAPADFEQSMHPDRLAADRFHVGFNPYAAEQYAAAFQKATPLREYWGGFVPDRLAAAFRDCIGEYYARLAADQGKSARFFAEKNNNLHRGTRLFARRAFGQVREIVLVRDPRDILCSHVSYFGSAPERAFEQLTHATRQLAAIRREAWPDVLMVRYEDVVGKRAEVGERLSAFLDVPVDISQGNGDIDAMFRTHATSATPAESVGRWRHHLAPDVAGRCNMEWNEFLLSFDYGA